MESIGFLVERNEDDSLSVWFSDKACFDDVDDETIDEVVFGYLPGIDKIQVFNEDQLYTLSAQDDQCH